MSQIQHNYAVIIGINEYQESNCQLKNAVNDACQLTNILEKRYQYKVLQLLDRQASSERLNDLLKAFEHQTIPFPHGHKSVTPDDRVLFYFAGHGITTRVGEKDSGPQGFIYAQNAIRGENSSLLPMRRLHDALTKLGCRHLLIILDCCFAGSFRWVVRQAEISEEEMYLERYNRYITGYAQEVITSSAYNETAADSLYDFGERGEDNKNSPFAKALLEALEPKNQQNADFNKDGVITSTEILQYIESKFLSLNAGQTPGYCQLKKHDYGKYLFFIPGFDADSNLKKAPLPDEKDPGFPYKGLLAFEESDRDNFFGRKTLTRKLTQKVRESTVTVVLGASGSGKSSLVKAGLIPNLERNYQSEFEIVSSIRPGELPLTALAKVCKDIKGSSLGDSSTNFWHEELSKNSDLFADIIGNWTLRHLNKKILLVIDQFEELITLCRDESERNLFWEQLARAIAQYPEQLRIVITLRSDYQPLLNSLFKSGLQESDQIDLIKARFEVSPMTRDELREAIVEPAEKIALFFEGKIQESESSLVDRLIDEVINMPGGLPLLSFTLSELYRRFFHNVKVGKTDNRLITHKDYEELGQVTGSLTKRADEIYNDLVCKNQNYDKIIKYVMLRMVAESTGDLARRRVFMTELEYPQQFQENVDRVIKDFTAAHLLVKGRDEQEREYVEPAHDVLVRGWDQLREWLKSNQEQKNIIAIQRRLTPAAEEWKNKQPEKLNCKIHLRNWLNFIRKKSDQASFLWDRDPYLDVLKTILESSNDNWYNQVETEFVRASIKKQKNNYQLRAGSIATAFVVVSGFAFVQWCQSRDSEIGKSVAMSQALFESNKQLEALIESLKAGQQLQLPIGIKPETKLQTITVLHNTVYGVRERNRLLGHKGTIRNISFSPDGQIIASSSADLTIKLWNLEGKLIDTLEGHGGLVNSVSFSPDGKMLASASYDKSIKLWSINRKLLGTYNAHQRQVYSVSFSPDGKMLASSSWDGTIKLWRVRDDQLQLWKTAELHPEILQAIAKSKDKNSDDPKPYSFHGVSFSPNGKLIAAAKEDGKVFIWSQEGKLLKILPAHDNDRVYGVSFSPDSKILADYSRNRKIKLWDVNKFELKITLTGHKADIYSATFSPDGKTLISGSEDNTVKFWRVEDGKELRTFAGHNNAVRSASISPNGKIIASGSIDSTIKLWNVDSEDILPLRGHNTTVNNVSFSGDGKIVATGGRDQTEDKKFYKIILWRKSDGKELRRLVGHKNQIITTSFSQDGQILASGDNGGNIILWNPVNGKEIRELSRVHPPEVRSLSFSPDGKILASAGSDKSIKLWNREGQLLKTLPGHKSAVSSISFSPDGKIMASAGKNGTIILWDSVKWEKIPGFKTETKAATNSISFSRDSKILAIAGEDRNITLWSIPGFDKLHTLSGHGEGINSVSFNPVSDLIASASDDKTVKIWDAKEGKEITTIKAHSAQVNSVSFSPDGKTLASASADSNVLLSYTKFLDLNTTLARGCRWVRNYQNNSGDDRICSDIPETNSKVKISRGKQILVSARPVPEKLAGVDAFIEEKFGQAAKHLQKYLEKYPNDPEALIYKNNAEIGQQKAYTIAVSAPLASNLNSALEILRGVAQAQNEINSTGGINGVKLRVLIADDENNPKVAEQIARTLVEDSNVLGIVGNYSSDVALATSKIYSENKLVAIYPVSTSVNLSSLPGFGNYIFRTVPSDRQAAIALGEYMQKQQLNTKKVAIFYNSQSEYSRSLKSEFSFHVKPEQISSVFDFSSKFSADKAVEQSIQAGAEILVLFPNTEQLNNALQVLNQNAKKGKLPVLGGDSLYSPITLEIGADKALDTAIAVAWNWETASKSDPKFTSDSEKLWKGYVNWRTAMSYDATQALIAAIHKKNTRSGVASVLRATDFTANGASSPVRFVNGDRDRNSLLVKISKRPAKSRSGYKYDFVPVP